MIRNLFPLIWDITHWNRLDIKNATGRKSNKSTRFFFFTLKKISSLGVHNATHNNRLKPVRRIPLSAVEWFDMRFNRSLQAWYCVRQGCQIYFLCTLYIILSVFNVITHLHFVLAANLVIHKTIERIHVGKQYGDIPRGVFVVRGENVMLLGEIVSIG